MTTSILEFVIAVILIPLVVLSYRLVIKWTETRDQLAFITGQLVKINEDKDKVHKELADQMREDRKATNDRLTWLEREVWKK